MSYIGKKCVVKIPSNDSYEGVIASDAAICGDNQDGIYFYFLVRTGRTFSTVDADFITLDEEPS